MGPIPRHVKRSRLLGQGAGFAASEVAVTGLGAISTALVARGLSAQGFGSQTFAVSFLIFTSLFFDFGLFLPSARLIAMTESSRRREVVGAALVGFMPVGLLFAIVVFGLSYGVDSWFNVHAGSAIRLIAPLALVYPFRTLGGFLAQGIDRLHVYSITSVLGQALYVLALAVITVAHVKLTVALALELRLAGMVVSSIVLVAWLAPVFTNAARLIRRLVEHARAYGFQMYVGAVLSIATYNMDVLMIGAMTNAKAVGYYSLAGSMAYMVGLPVYGMCKALFPRMTSRERMDPRWVTLSAASGLVCASAVALLAHPVISIVFSSRYLPAVALVLPLALAEAVRGVTTVYNTFLSAQGRGRDLRSAAFVLTGSNLVLNFALIPPFGALGAAWASLGALVVNFLAHVILYRRFISAPAAVATA